MKPLDRHTLLAKSRYASRYAHIDLLAGVDEVGRGPLAGPVVTAAVILPKDYSLEGLTDSKKTTAKQREHLFERINQDAVALALGEASIEEIDSLNILHATMLAMQRSVSALAIQPQHVLVDGNRCPSFPMSSDAIVKGDGLVDCISAASIIAKVHRDRLMQDYAVQYPHYGFESNAGYPTAQHRNALQAHGVTPIHRRSFAPVAKALLSEKLR